MFVFEFFYLAGLLYLAITIGWLLLLTLGSWFHREQVNREAPPLHLGVVIPAHNEELQIYDTIKNIRSCNYPQERLHIIVIADNCTDHTADAARGVGAQVVERYNEAERGKGQALDWFLQQYQNMYQHLDGICFVDADVRPDPDMFKELSASLAHPKVRVVQGFNGVANPFDNWRTALNTAAFNVFNHVRMAGNNRLFGYSSLRGLGMAFETSILQCYGWPAHSVIEDTEFTIILLKDEIKVHYNPKAIITSEMAGSRVQADRQRRRWEGGRFAFAAKILPKLINNVFLGHFRYIHTIMDLIIPPLSLLAAMLFCWMGIASLLGHGSVFLLFFLVGVLFFYVASAQFQRHASLKLWGYLFAAPIFVLWKLLLYVKMLFNRNSPAWVRTLRKTELQNYGGK